jgi:hypothetical protein
MGWFYLPQDRDKWQDLLNMVMHLGFLQLGEFLDWLKKYYFFKKGSSCS